MNASIIAPIVAFKRQPHPSGHLKTGEVLQEAKALAEQGFRHILLVAGTPNSSAMAIWKVALAV